MKFWKLVIESTKIDYKYNQLSAKFSIQFFVSAKLFYQLDKRSNNLEFYKRYCHMILFIFRDIELISNSLGHIHTSVLRSGFLILVSGGVPCFKQRQHWAQFSPLVWLRSSWNHQYTWWEPDCPHKMEDGISSEFGYLNLR